MKVRATRKGLIFHAPLTSQWQNDTGPKDISGFDNDCDYVEGTQTYSNAGMTTDDQVRFPATGIFENSLMSIAFRFTPTFDPLDDVDVFFYDSTWPDRYFMRHYADASGNFLLWYQANTFIGSSAPGTYSKYWLTNQENTMIITSDSSGDTSCYLNGNVILNADPTTWTPTARNNLWIGSVFNGTSPMPGTIRDFMIFDRILTATERAQFDAGTHGFATNIKTSSLQKGLQLHAPMTSKWLQDATTPSDLSPYRRHSTGYTDTPVYGATGVALSSTDFVKFDYPDLLSGNEFCVGLKFAPSYDADANLNDQIWGTDATAYRLFHSSDSSSNVLSLRFGGSAGTVALADYQPYWNTGQINTFVMQGNATDNTREIWLNGVKIQDAVAAWNVASHTTLNVGGDGVDRDLRIWNRRLTDAEVAEYTAWGQP